MLNHRVLVVHCCMSQGFIQPVNNKAEVYLSKNQDSTACSPSVLLKPVIMVLLFIFEERSFDLTELFCLLQIQSVMIQFCIYHINIFAMSRSNI